ncbi:hypothetical protein QG085_03415 [Kingella kingae]|nr:hypothetical protein [Kingella kingae]MDK4544520.1 hypothetical protein [Kingella kingae]MDK4628248.1 hypothetical protein [Kingella kingae]MDK4636098.1 hypothetical protein [Kingella kingae]MDK4638087.1 hypothetical protein [Kingella kingae]MDK4694882.1 hypothetical protein [Kingella kingae]
MHYDYHAPRLHKLVTETAPAAVSEVGINPKNDSTNPYKNGTLYHVCAYGWWLATGTQP